AHLVTGFALTTMGLDRVYIRCAEANIKSANIPRRLGYTYEGVLPEPVWIHKRFFAEIRFVMTAQTWFSQKMIYHITSHTEWEKAQETGAYRTASLDSQGFIHFSSLAQVLKVANTVYKGATDRVLLAVDTRQLVHPLKFEPPDTTIPVRHYDGELFPHLYGELNLSAVLRVDDLRCDEEGMFRLPAYLDK
ncbi:MAG: DUF952 domain-containing protein, partial [Anaerolineae bacterium]|nr:DUF952 domain-containing protein [Anaerolineae bacterium]